MQLTKDSSFASCELPVLPVAVHTLGEGTMSLQMTVLGFCGFV